MLKLFKNGLLTITLKTHVNMTQLNQLIIAYIASCCQFTLDNKKCNVYNIFTLYHDRYLSIKVFENILLDE